MRILNAAICLIAALMPGLARAQEQEKVEIISIEARLLYSHSATLSENILNPSFTAFNTVIGEGDAKEPALDVLVVVHVASPTNQETFTTTPVKVSVTDLAGKINVQRLYETVLTDLDGQTTVTLLVPESTCAGDLKIVATTGISRLERTLSLGCGE